MNKNWLDVYFDRVMWSLSVCVDMYAQSEAEKAACYRIFDDLRSEHETTTQISCDDFTTSTTTEQQK